MKRLASTECCIALALKITLSGDGRATAMVGKQTLNDLGILICIILIPYSVV